MLRNWRNFLNRNISLFGSYKRTKASELATNSQNFNEIVGPLALKSIGIIAFKALIISNVALTIAGIIALKKIYSNDSHEETSFQVHTGGDNRRNTYILRPVRPTGSNAQKTTTLDPYRYYSNNNNYEYPNYQ